MLVPCGPRQETFRRGSQLRDAETSICPYAHGSLRRSNPSKTWNSLKASKASSCSGSSFRSSALPLDPMELLKSNWNVSHDEAMQSPDSSIRGRRTRVSRGWHLARGRWHHHGPGVSGQLRPLTTGALLAHDQANDHDEFCRCEQCYGSLDVPRPASRSGDASQTQRGRRKLFALLPRVPEHDADWGDRLLGPTERFVRKLTMPSQHSLADAPPRMLRGGGVAVTRPATGDASAEITLNDVPRVGLESWEAKWQRELKFINVQRQREEAVRAAVGHMLVHGSNTVGSTRVPSRATTAACSRVSSPAPSHVSIGSRASCPAPRAPSDSGTSACFRGTWAAYEAACAKLDAKLARGDKQVRVSDVPWPPKSSVCGFLPEDSPKERKRKLKKALLRWHPDKWHAAIQASPERERLAGRLAEVTQRILDERALA